IVLIAALTSGRLSIAQSLVAVAAITLAFLAWKQIQFPIPLLTPKALHVPQWVNDWLAISALCAAAMLAALLVFPAAARIRPIIVAAAVLLGGIFSWQLFQAEASGRAS